jgi:hypothetical protein
MNKRWSIGVVTLNAMVHRFHRLPNSHIVRIVSAVVPVRVVTMAVLKSDLRKWCEFG